MSGTALLQLSYFPTLRYVFLSQIHFILAHVLRPTHNEGLNADRESSGSHPCEESLFVTHFLPLRLACCYNGVQHQFSVNPNHDFNKSVRDTY